MGRDFRPPPDRPRRGADAPRNFDGPPRGFEGLPRAFDGPFEATINNGFLFIDGQYLQPPYKLLASDKGVEINDLEIHSHAPTEYPFGRAFGGPQRGEPPWHRLASRLRNDLDRNAVLFAFADQTLFVPDESAKVQFMKSLLSAEGRSARQIEVRHQLPDDFDKDLWDEWISGFIPPEALKVRAAAVINDYDRQQRENLAQIRARRLLENLQYPLSVSAMILSVLSLGHLLGGRPHAGKPTRGLDLSPETIRAVNWSLLFAAAFSVFDLVWTILMANAKEILELNPIGTHLIQDPRQLAGFKVSITFACLAIIWLLRRHKRAQVAAWWICLVLTLLTCRWLLATSLVTAASS
jgi:hypothetical protein